MKSSKKSILEKEDAPTLRSIEAKDRKKIRDVNVPDVLG